MGAFSSIGAFDSHRQVALARETDESTPLSQDLTNILSGAPKSSGSDDDIGNDPNAFNMTRSLGVDIDNYFPIRPMRDELKFDNKEVVKVESALSGSEPFVSTSGEYISPEELIELDRVAEDHKIIAREFNILSRLDRSTPALEPEARPEIEQKLFFFQMPVLGPKFEVAVDGKSTSKGKGNDKGKGKDGGKGSSDQTNSEDPANALSTRYPEGLAGKLRLHKSGKLTMVLGNIVMEVSQGIDASFLQDVVAISPEDQKAHLIGQVTRKMIVSPDINELLK